MKLIKQKHTILAYPKDAIHLIELAGRTCYQSKSKDESYESGLNFVEMLKRKGHHSMLEFGWVMVKFITNRGVTHELVRHRLCSFAQESTRYVKYDGDMEFIEPVWWDQTASIQKAEFKLYLEKSEEVYKSLLKSGWAPQQAREVLPNALKTEIVMGANLREWRHILELRCARTAHPQTRELMKGLLIDLRGRVPMIFNNVKQG